VPTVTDVESELDNVAAEINAELEAFGYTVPINATDYPTARALAKAANEYGAAARILSTMPQGSYNPDEQMEDTGENRPNQYEKLLNRFLKRIREKRLKAGRAYGRLHRVFAGASKNDDGADKKPLFTRDMDSYPGTRDFTDETEEEEDEA
jgi:hypothetical protein